jgi:hypothetical protein
MKLLCTEKCWIDGKLYRDGKLYEFTKNPNPSRFIVSQEEQPLIKTTLKEENRDLGLTQEEYDMIVEHRAKKKDEKKPVQKKPAPSKK